MTLEEAMLAQAKADMDLKDADIALQAARTTWNQAKNASDACNVTLNRLMTAEKARLLAACGTTS